MNITFLLFLELTTRHLVIAPSHTQDLLLWDNLPREIPQSATLTVFKSKLTTYFFRLAYNPSWYYMFLNCFIFNTEIYLIFLNFYHYNSNFTILRMTQTSTLIGWFFLLKLWLDQGLLAVMPNALLKRPKDQNSKNSVWISKENPTISLTAAARARKVIKSMKHRNWKTWSSWRICISELLWKAGFVRCCGWWKLRKS